MTRGRFERLVTTASGTDGAEPGFKVLRDHDPDDAPAYHAPGILPPRTRPYDEALQAYRQSLRFRACDPDAYLNLGDTLKDSGPIYEAIAAVNKYDGWPTATRRRPGYDSGSPTWASGVHSSE